MTGSLSIDLDQLIPWALAATGTCIVGRAALLAALIQAARFPGALGARCARLAGALAPGIARRMVAAALGLAAPALSLAPSAMASPTPPAPVLAATPAPAPPPNTWQPTRGQYGIAPGQYGIAPGQYGIAPDQYIVARGDTLWGIARDHLPALATDSQIARAWPRWYQLNRAAIGPDPNHIRPGLALRIPDGRPTGTSASNPRPPSHTIDALAASLDPDRR